MTPDNGLTEGRTGIQQQARLIQGITYMSIAAYVACILTHVCICLPPSRSWQIKPYPGGECISNSPAKSYSF